MGVQKSLGSLEGESRTRKCPDCGSTEIERRGDEFYCKKCGLVLD
jgi:ribosomal protein S27AE